MSLANYNAVGFYNDTLTVYCADAASTTAIAAEGQALCWDVAATLSATDPKTRLGNQVKQPATARLMAFAGLVTASCAGRAYPCFVDIVPHQKNRFARASLKQNSTAFSSLLGPVDAQYDLGTHADSGVNLNFVGIAAETADTSSTAAVKTILFK